MRLSFAGSLQYVVSNEKFANDLLRERGNLYSSREQTPAAAQLLSGSLRPLLLPYNGELRTQCLSIIVTDVPKSYGGEDDVSCINLP